MRSTPRPDEGWAFQSLTGYHAHLHRRPGGTFSSSTFALEPEEGSLWPQWLLLVVSIHYPLVSVRMVRLEYFVVTSSRGLACWAWEIRVAPQPLGGLLSGADFRTELAGEKALVELLRRLAEEEARVS